MNPCSEQWRKRVSRHTGCSKWGFLSQITMPWSTGKTYPPIPSTSCASCWNAKFLTWWNFCRNRENRRQTLAGSGFFMQNVQKDKNVPSRDKKPRRKLIDFHTISWLKSLILIRKASPNGAASFVIYKERNHKTSLIWTPCPSGN